MSDGADMVIEKKAKKISIDTNFKEKEDENIVDNVLHRVEDDKVEGDDIVCEMDNNKSIEENVDLDSDTSDKDSVVDTLKESENKKIEKNS